MTAAGGAYLPSPSLRPRAWVLSLIAGAHALVVLALLAIGSVAQVVERTPMLVSFLPEPARAAPALPLRSVPLPQLVKPVVRVSDPPPVEIIQSVETVERPVPPPLPPPALVMAQPARVPAPAAPAPLEPPRFDLAYLDNPAPAYPVFAKRAREQGVVMLRVRVDAGGRVEGIEVDRSSGSERLDNAALAAVRKWRFVPARRGDRGVAGVALVPIHFQLDS